MRRRLRHDVLLILLICSWIPVAIAGVLILTQMYSYLDQIDQAREQRRLDQAKLALNSQMLSVEAIAEILLASRELNDFMFVTESAGAITPMTGNLLHGRISLLQAKVPEIKSFTVVNKKFHPIYSYPPSSKAAHSHHENAVGFILVDQNTLRYQRPIAYDDQDFPGPSAKLKGYLSMDVDLSHWRSSLSDAVTINRVGAESSIADLDLSLTQSNAVGAWQFVPYLLVLVIVLIVSTMAGLRLTRSRIVTPIMELTRYVSGQMNKVAPDYPQHHEIDVLRESFDTYVRYERELNAKLLQQSTLAAIGRTTQMLAHDVRKPFSMLKSLVQLLRGARDQADVHQLIHRLAPEIDRATHSVEDLIRDIMDVGSDREPNREIVHLSTLVQTTLVDAVRLHVGCQLGFRYRFEHRHALSGDPVQLTRVFTNIVANAIEAMHGRGELWFESREPGDGMIEIVIGNSDSFVPEDKRERIFEPFFTEGKGGGTGLGLAIVKKFISGHGGTIRCESTAGVGTQFIFTLPTSTAEANEHAHELPKSSRQIEEAFDHIQSAHDDLAHAMADEELLAEQIAKWAKERAHPIRILLADDESLYRQALESRLNNSPLKPYVRLVIAHSGEEAVAASAAGSFDVVVMDVNFGAGGLDGFDATRQIRANGYLGVLCIHSNCGIVEYQRKAIAAGADLFILKPMSRLHLYQLIQSAIAERPAAQSAKLIP